MNAAPSQAKTLRRLYLTLFLRGRSSRGLKREKAPNSIGSKLALTLAFYALAGWGCTAFIGDSPAVLSSVLHGGTIFLVGMFVASSSGEVLFNQEEAEILLHRPIPPRTLLWAKISVLLQVSLWMSLAFNLAGMIYGSVGEGGNLLFAPAHAISSVLSAFLCTGAVVLIYQLCLRWFGRERLDGLMTTAQVLMTLVLVLGGQILPHVMRQFKGDLHLDTYPWWLTIIPPAWFMGLDEVLTGRGTAPSWLLASLAVISTALVMTLAFGKLAGSYESGLRTLSESRTKRAAKPGQQRWLQRLVSAPPLRWLLRDPLERAAFLLVSAYMFRDRDVKLRLYPGMAPIMVMPLVLLVNGGRKGGADDFMLMLAGGYICLVPMLALSLLKFSQHWQAADIFRATPIPGPGPILSGARKAVDIFITLPALALIGGGCVFIGGSVGSLLSILPGVLALPFFSRVLTIREDHLPLSRPNEEAKAPGRGLMIFLSIMGAVALAGAAAVAKSFGYYYPFLAVEAVLSFGAAFLMDRRTAALRWELID